MLLLWSCMCKDCKSLAGGHVSTTSCQSQHEIAWRLSGAGLRQQLPSKGFTTACEACQLHPSNPSSTLAFLLSFHAAAAAKSLCIHTCTAHRPCCPCGMFHATSRACNTLIAADTDSLYTSAAAVPLVACLHLCILALNCLFVPAKAAFCSRLNWAAGSQVSCCISCTHR